VGVRSLGVKSVVIHLAASNMEMVARVVLSMERETHGRKMSSWLAVVRQNRVLKAKTETQRKGCVTVEGRSACSTAAPNRDRTGPP
jgi:hypothetical protein